MTSRHYMLSCSYRVIVIQLHSESTLNHEYKKRAIQNNLRAPARTDQPICASLIQEKETVMKMEKMIRVLAGTMVLLSLILAQFLSPWWLLLAAFVGVNLIQSSFTGFCPAEILLRKLGAGKEGSCCGSS